MIMKSTIFIVSKNIITKFIFAAFFKISIYALEGSKILIFSNHIGVEGLVFRHQNRTSVRWRRDDEILERLATLQPRNLAPSTNTY